VVLPRIAPIVAFVRSLDEEVYLGSEVAPALGISATTLRRLTRTDEQLGPSLQVAYGSRTIGLYSMRDVDHLRSVLITRWPDHPDGRPRRRPGSARRWSDAERRDRHRALRRASYYRSRGRRLAGHSPEAARMAFAKAEHLTSVLDHQLAERRREASAPTRALSYIEWEHNHE
jgi:hypothetical protein